MPSIKLIKALEKKGFFLNFPDYNSNEEIIIEIIKENNPRITPSLILFLNEDFDYKKITSKLNKKEKEEFNNVIILTEKIYEKEHISNTKINTLKTLIKENKLKSTLSKSEFNNFFNKYHDLLKESTLNFSASEQKIIEKQSKLRLNLNLNKSLQVLFSPAKILIMEKIFNHKKLTNSELKYYYRSISNINKSALNPALQDYVRIIELTKKDLQR